MEARKRAMQKRKKLRTLGKSRSTESEDEEEEEAEGEILDIPVCQIINFQGYRRVKYEKSVKPGMLEACIFLWCFVAKQLNVAKM